MTKKHLFIDNLQYSNWSPEIFDEMKEGNLTAVHVTISYHENFRQTIENIIAWNKFIDFVNNQLPNAVIKVSSSLFASLRYLETITMS